ncbi:phosphotransferase [Kribbella flavida]|nr:phosphotransferase [Kribbella flavida]
MLPSGLSMLWEPVEPEGALRERFGLLGFDGASDWVAEVLAEVWGIAVEGCDRVVISDANAIVWMRTEQGRLVVKWSRAEQRFEELAASARLLGALAARGVPVAAPVPAVDGRTRVVLGGPSGKLSVAVLPEIDGDWLDVGDEAAVHAAGACLASLHHALAEYADADPAVSHGATGDSGEDLRERLTKWLATDDRGVTLAASQRLAAAVAALPPLDTREQLVHNDYRAANLLTRDSAVVGILDFDEIARQHPVHDLAKAFVYLSTLFTEWKPTAPGVRRTFLAGYESVRRLSPAEHAWLETLALWVGIQAVPTGDDPAGWAKAL